MSYIWADVLPGQVVDDVAVNGLGNTVEVHDVLIAALQAQLGAITNPWTAYTPAWTGSVTNPAIVDGSLKGFYAGNGHLGILQISIDMGAGTTFGSGSYSFGLPPGWTSAATSARNPGVCLMRDNSGATHNVGGINIAGSATVFDIRANGGNVVGAAVPFVFAVSDFIHIGAVVELA